MHDLLLDALKQGHYCSSQGPLIHDVSIDGRELHVSKLERGWLLTKQSPWFRVVVIVRLARATVSSSVFSSASPP